MFVVPDVLAVQDVPSVEVRRVPDPPPVTKSPFPYVTLLRLFVVPEVLEVQVVPLSDEVSMVPELPTATNETLEVVVVVLSVVVLLSSLLFLAQEMKVILKRDMRIKCKILFIFFCTGDDGKTENKGENNEYIFHLVSNWWF